MTSNGDDMTAHTQAASMKDLKFCIAPSTIYGPLLANTQLKGIFKLATKCRKNNSLTSSNSEQHQSQQKSTVHCFHEHSESHAVTPQGSGLFYYESDMVEAFSSYLPENTYLCTDEVLCVLHEIFQYHGNTISQNYVRLKVALLIKQSCPDTKES